MKMSESKDKQILHDQMIKKLEKTKFWKAMLQSISRFEDSEKEFFLDRIREYYCAKEQIMLDYYSELITSISNHYKPAAEAKRIRLVILIGQFGRKGSIPSIF